ncbi:hypothetical protein RchiOBHm_Chr6g0302521 [Rosa chinensis]|uniref:Uncharacterized protein n=1 Tax=Rosa chinensis TaxID=74649 RepID=A0A2P6PZ21_ROSCH|nr:hypothetical protein RchiOBHm_Chr6g0302521 [Rosa chinensis]
MSLYYFFFAPHILRNFLFLHPCKSEPYPTVSPSSSSSTQITLPSISVFNLANRGRREYLDER